MIQLKIFLILISSLFFALSHASDKTDLDWQKQLNRHNLAISDQSYCYTDETNKVAGSNIDMRIRLASVSKLITTLWAVEELGVHHKFKTKLFIKDNDLHIEGTFDPFLGNEKMFFLISQLNDLGYKQFNNITFDKNVIINPNAQLASDEYPEMSAQKITGYLSNYFNTAKWSKDLKNEYDVIARSSNAGRINTQVSFSAKSISYSPTNPFENDPNARMLTLSSPDLFKYLKEMNIRSNNYVAETIFRKLGSTNSFQQFLETKYGITSDQVFFFTGSGLPATLNGLRKDNYATCSIILSLIAKLKTSVENQLLELENIVAVPGSDGGTFRNRTFPADFKNSFVAKTGTLMHTSTLAGAMNTQNGFSFFGIFNQTTDIAGAKAVQNSMVSSIMLDMGGPKSFDYKVEDFYTYNEENVKKLEIPFFTDDSSDFVTYETNLY